MTISKVRDITAAHLGQMVQVNGYLGRVQSMSIAENPRYVELQLVDEDGEESTKTWVRLDDPASSPAESVPQSTWTCVYGRCEGASFTGAPADAEAWMDQHVIDRPHDARWAASFRIDYPGSTIPGVAYRTAVTL